MAKVGNATVGLGMGGTIVFGIWLAFALDGYAIWDGWIIAAIVLWFVGAALGPARATRTSKGPKKALELEKAGADRPERRVARAQPHVERRCSCTP